MTKGVIKGKIRARRGRRNRNNMERAIPGYLNPQERKREDKKRGQYYHGGRRYHGYSPSIRISSEDPMGGGAISRIGYYHEPTSLDLMCYPQSLEAGIGEAYEPELEFD